MTTLPAGRPLPRTFYERETAVVARALLGHRLVRSLNGQRLSGLICETEAYGGANDPASHAYRRTLRSAIMFGSPSTTYVYFIYGKHYCLNVVTECDGSPGAVLIRGLIPVEGIETMRGRRPGVIDRHLADGPGKLCQALGITLALNGGDLSEDAELFITVGKQMNASQIMTTPRVGVHGDDEAKARPWRFLWQPSQHPAESDPNTETTSNALA